jgi:hypothetical protein
MQSSRHLRRVGLRQLLQHLQGSLHEFCFGVVLAAAKRNRAPTLRTVCSAALQASVLRDSKTERGQQAGWRRGGNEGAGAGGGGTSFNVAKLKCASITQDWSARVRCTIWPGGCAISM